MEEILVAGGLAMLVLEGVKLIVRKIKKQPDFDFPTVFYTISIPVLNALAPFALFWLGFVVDSPVLSMGWLDLVKYIIIILLGSLVSLVGYNTGVKPMKNYAEEQKALG